MTMKPKARPPIVKLPQYKAGLGPTRKPIRRGDPHPKRPPAKSKLNPELDVPTDLPPDAQSMRTLFAYLERIEKKLDAVLVWNRSSGPRPGIDE